MGFKDPDGFYVEVIWHKARRAGLRDAPTGELDHRRAGLILDRAPIPVRS